MKNISKILLMFILLGTVQGCLKYDELRDNPNDATTVPPSLLLTQVIPRPESSFESLYRNSQFHNFLPADLGVASPVNYRYGSVDFTYDQLRNNDKMIELAQAGDKMEYVIIGKFLKAYYFIEMTRRMGDIPLSEALKGADNPLPKYDTQKSVYIQCLDWLDEANAELGNFIAQNPEVALDGDFYYNGNLAQWQKAINAYTVRVLISLSRKADDPDVNVKGRFSKLINDPATYPLMTGIQDNMQITHKDEDTFRGAYNPNQQIVVEGVVYADTYIELLKGNKDPRLFQVAEPIPAAMASNPDAEAVRMDFNSYGGSDISLSQEVNNTIKTGGGFSAPRRERFLNFVGQPSSLLTYWEQELEIAEAAHLGWIGASAQEHYINGVAGSMQFYNVGAADITDYLTNDAPYISGDAGLVRIREQLYIALAENTGWEAWFLQRRTGVPTFKFSSINNVEKLPVRWAYPTSEDTDNHDNYRAALRRQFGSEVDDRDQVMWLLKN